MRGRDRCRVWGWARTWPPFLLMPTMRQSLNSRRQDRPKGALALITTKWANCRKTASKLICLVKDYYWIQRKQNLIWSELRPNLSPIEQLIEEWVLIQSNDDFVDFIERQPIGLIWSFSHTILNFPHINKSFPRLIIRLKWWSNYKVDNGSLSVILG